MSHVVSIGLPVFNDAEFLPSALTSLLDQSFSDFELIISDDGSTDGSEQICRDFSARDSRIRYVRQPANLGISRNMEFLLAQAEGEFFMWAGDDDLWHPTFVEILVDALRDNPNAISAYTPMCFIDENGDQYPGTVVRRTDYSGTTSYRRLKKLVRVFDDAFGYGLFRREAILGVRFPVWWGVNRHRAHNNIYPTLCYYLASGDFVIVGDSALHFKRIKHPEHRHHVTPHDGRAVREFLAFALWKVNLVAVSLWQIARAGRPLTALRLTPSMVTWWVLAATKGRIVRLRRNRLRRTDSPQ